MKVKTLKQLLDNVDDMEVVICKDEVEDVDGYDSVYKALVIDDLSKPNRQNQKFVIISEN